MPNVKRVILIALLLSILASCRILCAAAECGHAHEPLGAAEESQQEAPHPVNDDDCICNGGLQADGAGPILASLDPDRVFLGFDLPLLVLFASHSPLDPSHAAPDWPEHLPMLGGAPEVCARLQRYRL